MMRRMARLSRGEALILCGSVSTVAFGLLSALTPALAYTTVVTNSFGYNPPDHQVVFTPLEFSLHVYSLKFAMVALSGLIALLAFTRKRILPQAALATVILGNLSLVLTAANERRGTIPEATLFDVISVGGLVAVAGLVLLSLGLALYRRNAPRWATLSGFALLSLYVVHPVLVVAGYFPELLFGGKFTSVNMLLAVMMYSAQLLMVWAAYNGVKSTFKDRIR
jgi:hypothetical protein